MWCERCRSCSALPTYSVPLHVLLLVAVADARGGATATGYEAKFETPQTNFSTADSRTENNQVTGCPGHSVRRAR